MTWSLPFYTTRRSPLSPRITGHTNSTSTALGVKNEKKLTYTQLSTLPVRVLDGLDTLQNPANLPH
ncbi:hypothetical protein BT69DRAFT_1278204 [Atractiella rhizophila]|nr:hypothetical protein BT69DRAFT_1278204 [Atractiella rhizophila]